MVKILTACSLFAFLAVPGCTKDQEPPPAETAEPAEATGPAEVANEAPDESAPDEKFVVYKGEQDEFTVEIPTHLNTVKVKQSQGPQGKWRTNEYRADAKKFIGGIMIRCQKFAEPGIPAQNVAPMLDEGVSIWCKGKTPVFEKKIQWADTDAVRLRTKQEHQGKTIYADYLLAYLPANRTAYTVMFISSNLEHLDGEAGQKFFESFKYKGR